MSEKGHLQKTYEIISYVRSLTDLPLIVNFSGGKDSSALLLATLDVTENVEALYMDSGITLPHTLDFVKKQAKHLGIKLHISYPEESLLELVERFGYFPMIHKPFCSIYLKIRPARHYFRSVYGKQTLYKLVAVRKSESTRRSSMYDWKRRKAKYYPVVDEKFNIIRDDEHRGSFMVYPILHWTDQNVLDFLEKKKFKVEKDYEDFGVSGCYWCPFYQESIYRRVLEAYPNIYDEIIALEKRLGKPSVGGKKFLWQIKESFMAESKLDEHC